MGYAYMNMIHTFISSKDNNHSTYANITTNNTPSLYSVFSNLTEQYYKNSLSLIRESASSHAPKYTLSRKILEWLLPTSDNFYRFIVSNNKLIDKEILVIKRMMKKNRTYQFRSYYIEELKISPLSIPKRFPSNLDKISYFKSLITDSSKKITTTNFYSSIDDWFVNNQTPESMYAYFNKNVHVYQDGKVVFVKDSVDMLKDFTKEISIKFKSTKSSVESAKKELDTIIKEKSSLDTMMTKYLSSNDDKRSAFIKDLYTQYSKDLAFGYIQLSVYYRACMMLYGKAFTTVTNLIHDMFEDTDECTKRLMFEYDAKAFSGGVPYIEEVIK